MVSDPDQFLKELHRLIKEDGRLLLEDGHQPREKSKEKVEKSGLWKIIKEHKKYLICYPV